MNGSEWGFFHKIYYSMAGFNYYKFFIRQRTGAAVVYLMLISLIIGIAGILPGYFSSNKIVEGIISNFDKSVPDFTFANGKLDVKGNMPIIIGDVGTTVIIDRQVVPMNPYLTIMIPPYL